MTGIQILKGKIITKIDNSSDEITFTDSEGKQYRMWHSQSCCESVTVDDIVGDLDDLLNSPILEAEEVVSSDEGPEGWKPDEYQESYTWTFYKLGTIKGHVTIRWFGSSNGYYSETVSFVEVGSEQDYY